MKCEKCGSENIRVEYIQIYTKEKIDLPKKSKLERPAREDINYPEMPETKIIRALQHAYDELGEENWSNKAKAMPVVARHIETEAREHYYKKPKDFYNYYANTPIEVIKMRTADEVRDNIIERDKEILKELAK
jgi:hypothetical protein